MKLANKCFMLTLQEDVTIGNLKATLVAQVMGNKSGYDIEYIDTDNITYMGIDINGIQNWRKFRDFHKEMGIDFDEILSKEFDKIFTEEVVKDIVNALEFEINFIN